MQVEEGQDVLSALRAGEVDALVVAHPDGDRVFTLQSEDRIYRVLVEHVGMGAALLARDGSVLFCNGHLAALLGRPAEGLFGQPLASLMSEGGRAGLEQALKEIDGTQSVTCYADLLQPDGKPIPVQIALSSLGDNSDIAVSAVFTDLSQHRRTEQWLEERVRERTAELETANELLRREVEERRRVEGALRESEDRFRTFNETLEQRIEERTALLRRSDLALRDSEEKLRYVLEASGLGAWSLDLNTFTVWRSPHHDRIFGYDEMLPEWNLSLFLDHLLPEDRERVRESIEEARAGKQKFWSAECRIRRNDGAVRSLRIRCHLRRDASGERATMLGLTQDITEEKRVEEALRQSERLAAMGEAMAVIGHESRNALQRSQVCMDMLSRRLADNPDALRLIGMARNAHDDIQRVHEEIREYAAPIMLRRSLQPVDRIWREAWEDLAEARQGRTAELLETLSVPESSAVVDEFRLKQVFRNIMENSLHACPDPVVIRIECNGADLDGRDALCIAICDNGPGLQPEQRDRAFEPFYTTKTKGTGLGMTITKRVVEGHGGQVSLGESEGPGLEVILVLPRFTE
jgi:PAS domain S-box-containing protein